MDDTKVGHTKGFIKSLVRATGRLDLRSSSLVTEQNPKQVRLSRVVNAKYLGGRT